MVTYAESLIWKWEFWKESKGGILITLNWKKQKAFIVVWKLAKEEISFCGCCLINIYSATSHQLLSFPSKLVLWAACQEEVYCSWQGTWISNYQIPALIAITWTPRQGELLEKNVISAKEMLLPTACLDTYSKQTPDKFTFLKMACQSITKDAKSLCVLLCKQK